MSGILPPPALKKKTYTITSADLVNSIPIQITSPIKAYSMESDAAYNGQVISEFQKEDGTWFPDLDVSVGNQLILEDSFTAINGANFGAGNLIKFPFVLRFRINIQAGAGTCKLLVYYL
jgi:hypothetical protein